MTRAILSVPDTSQRTSKVSVDACGPTCVLDLLNWIAPLWTVDYLASKTALATGATGLPCSSLVTLGQLPVLPLVAKTGVTMAQIQNEILAGRTGIILTQGNLEGQNPGDAGQGHFVTWTGFDDALQQLQINDPDNAIGTPQPGAGVWVGYSLIEKGMAAYGNQAVFVVPDATLIYPAPTVASQSVTVITPPITWTPATVTLPAKYDSLNVRAAASPTATILTSIAQSAPIQVNLANAGNGYVQIQTPAGFVFQQYITVTPTTPTTPITDANNGVPTPSVAGIDISAAQAISDPSALAEAGYGFVAVRAGNGTIPDPNFVTSMKALAS